MRSLWRALATVALLGIGWIASVDTVLAASAPMKPTHLTCDAMVEPLGIDPASLHLSWQLRDSSFGARQTAYQIQVASNVSLLQQNKPDVWDSGEVKSDRSVDVAYGGPTPAAEKRYYWRVKVWDKDGKPYPTSDASWWETGLDPTEQWQAKWIGYEAPEEKRVRTSGAQWITNAFVADFKGGEVTRHDFRVGFAAPKAVKRATLYVTGYETAAAWVNGKQVVEAQPMPAWKQYPWQTYTTVDVTADVRTGRNLLAVEVTDHPAAPNGGAAPNNSQAPMNACLTIEMADGTSTVITSGSGWKATLNGEGQWQASGYNDDAWQAATPFTPAGTRPGPPWPTGTVKALRKNFDAKGSIISARLYATALGAYQLRVNGRRVGDQVLAPGWMDFREHVPYQAYDVTSLVKTGANAIGAYLAPGWYATPLMWFKQGNNYGSTPPALKAELRIEYGDGSVQWVATDESWQAAESPMLKAEIYDGETYDARRVESGWDTAGFQGHDWKAAESIHPNEPKIVAQYFPPIRVEKLLGAKTVTQPKPGVYVYDFGQNLPGVASLRAQGAAGTDVRLRFAEVLNPDGTIYVENLRTAKATDHFILAGKGIEEYQPTFTYHGFRYVEVTGLSKALGKDALRAVVFHTDAPFTAQLHTGSALINLLWENILWGQRSNFMSVPTDCPQRDERLGWTADAQVFWRTAAYNMDLTQFTKKFGSDLRGTQEGTTMYGIFAPGTITENPGYGAGWSDAGVIIPWTGWLQSGDTRTIQENWSGMEKYLASIEADNPDYLWKKNFGTPFGDWLSPEGRTKEPLVATAYWAYDVTLMREMAHALGKTEDEARYGAIFDKIKAAFGKEFVQSDGVVTGADRSPTQFGESTNPTAKDNAPDTQTGYVLALEMNLLPDSLRQSAAEHLVEKIKNNNWRLGTGFLGTPYLLAALTDTGHSDVAYRLLLNTEYPSWGYLVGHGATTMWERWNGDQMMGDPGMNSYNHYAYGAVADWIYRYAAGVDATPGDAGFHTIALHPNFDSRMGSLEFTYQSRYGEIKSSWSMQGGHTLWKVTVPPNTTAQLPLLASRSGDYTLDGTALEKSKNIRLLKPDGEMRVYEFAAGTYSIEVNSR